MMQALDKDWANHISRWSKNPRRILEFKYKNIAMEGNLGVLWAYVRQTDAFIL